MVVVKHPVKSIDRVAVVRVEGGVQLVGVSSVIVQETVAAHELYNDEKANRNVACNKSQVLYMCNHRRLSFSWQKWLIESGTMNVKIWTAVKSDGLVLDGSKIATES